MINRNLLYGRRAHHGFLLLLLVSTTLPVGELLTTKTTINCQVIQFVDNPGFWNIAVDTRGFDGKPVHRTLAEDGQLLEGNVGNPEQFKKRSKALKECDKIVGQWENLYNPKRKGKRK